MESFYITKEGLEKLKEQLDFLMKVKRREITESLAHARAFGDLAENAEYHAAKDAQSINEARVRELSEKLAAARIMDENAIDKEKITLGCTAVLKDLKYDEEFEYALVSDIEADFDKNKISVSSPVGRGLIGKKVDEIAEITVPAGVLRYQVLKIIR
jgi:transcription elongation factor GreA